MNKLLINSAKCSFALTRSCVSASRSLPHRRLDEGLQPQKDAGLKALLSHPEREAAFFGVFSGSGVDQLRGSIPDPRPGP